MRRSRVMRSVRSELVKMLATEWVRKLGMGIEAG